MLLHDGGFILLKLLPQMVKLLLRAGSLKANYLCIVSHHFMSAGDLATPQGRERLAACAFRVPINGALQPMCAVNALGLREAFYGRPAPANLIAA